jgi:hypothetical protein
MFYNINIPTKMSEVLFIKKINFIKNKVSNQRE